VQDPGPYLDSLGVELPCAVEPERLARLDDAHRIFVNWEAYFVSSDEARTRFERAPWRYVGSVTDPVAGARFQPIASSPHYRYKDRLFYFTSAEALAKFEQDPAKYATPMLGMVAQSAE
jgi:YHS domain-containing protein